MYLIKIYSLSRLVLTTSSINDVAKWCKVGCISNWWCACDVWTNIDWADSTSLLLLWRCYSIVKRTKEQTRTSTYCRCIISIIEPHEITTLSNMTVNGSANIVITTSCYRQEQTSVSKYKASYVFILPKLFTCRELSMLTSQWVIAIEDTINFITLIGITELVY